jgi:diguanylate cyclase (GGDEF)-like protein/PAS domain S-box-containing protein
MRILYCDNIPQVLGTHVRVGGVEVAALPENESKRLAALRRLGLLDTPAEESYDRIVRMASAMLDVPIALVSLVDEDRQWFKAKVGLDVECTDRDEAFCAHAIVKDDERPFVVEDASLDPRFSDNPLVVAEPSIRFYAGQPLREPSGYRVGTLCAIDSKPRVLTGREEAILADLAAMVEELMARRNLDDMVAALDHSERRKSMVLETMDEGLIVQSVSGEIIEWNRAAETILGLSRDELTGRAQIDPSWATVHEDGTVWAADDRPSRIALRTGEPVRGAVMGIDRPGLPRTWMRVTATPINDAQDSEAAVLTTFADITERHVLEQSLKQFQLLFRHANDIIVVMDAEGHVRYASPSNRRVLGYPEDTRLPRGVLDLVHPDDEAEALEALTGVIAGSRGADPFEMRIRTFDGEWRYLECTAKNLLDEPDVAGIVITARDVSERHRLTEALAHEASHDRLTGLPNRGCVQDHLVGALARAARSGEVVAVCYIDLDGFKATNDKLGHAAGDELLIDASARLLGSIRTGDVAGRLGGDEFVAILDPVAGAEEAEMIGDRIAERLSGDRILTNGVARCGGSVGVAVARPGETASEVLHRADQALYAAKQSGRGRSVLAPT